jgi:urease accessory protein
LEVCAGELRLLEDSVLADLLEQRGLELEHRQAPFLPEAGAYAAAGGHRHGHGHNHGHADHDHDPGRGLDHDHGPSPADHPTHG